MKLKLTLHCRAREVSLGEKCFAGAEALGGFCVACVAEAGERGRQRAVFRAFGPQSGLQTVFSPQWKERQGTSPRVRGVTSQHACFYTFKKALFKNNTPRKESGVFLKNTLAAEWRAGCSRVGAISTL